MYCTSLFFTEFLFPLNKVLAVFPVCVVNVNFCEDGSSRFAVFTNLTLLSNKDCMHSDVKNDLSLPDVDLLHFYFIIR